MPRSLVVVLLVMTAACSSTGHARATIAPLNAAPTSAPSAPSTAAPPRPTTAHPRWNITLPAPVPAAGWSAGPWQAAGRAVNGAPAVFTTMLQPDNGQPPVAAARLETTRLRVVLYAGTAEPTGTWSAGGAVAPSVQPALVATFNSGFKLSASRGGWFADGRAAIALRDGAASLVIYQDGSATVGAWGRDAQLTGPVVAVRQNLELLVDGGRASSNIATNVEPTWGFTLSGAIFNWRSALGVDGAGRLLYVGGPGLDPTSLAGAIIAVGAVRAMELDINPAWVSFDTFDDGPSGVVGTKLLPAMALPATHFLFPNPRDFVAVFAR